MAEVKTDATMTAEELAAAKVAAKEELATALDGYKQEDYSEDNWTIITTAKTDGDTAIDEAEDVEAVTAAKDAALAAMDEVLTLAQEAIIADKIAAKEALATALDGYKQEDYSEDNWTILTTAKTDGDAAIDAATDLDGINQAKDDALAAMAAVKTKVQELDELKAAAKEELNNELAKYKEGDYTADNWSALNMAKTDGDAAIDAAADQAAITAAKDQAIAAMKAIEVKGDEEEVKKLAKVKKVGNVFTNTKKITGTHTENGATVTVKFGKKTKTAKVKNKKFSVKIGSLKPGTKVIISVSKDGFKKSGNVSKTVKLQKATANFRSKAKKVKGTAYKGAKIKFKLAGRTYTTKANKKGKFTVNLKKKPKKNSKIKVTSTFGKFKSNVKIKVK